MSKRLELAGHPLVSSTPDNKHESSSNDPAQQPPPSIENFLQAARANDAACLKALLQSGISVNAQNVQKETALHAASRAHCTYNAVQLLIDSKADLTMKDSHGQTALHHAVFTGLKL